MTLEYSVRGYAGGAPATTLSSGITNSATSLTIASGTGYPTTNFALVIDPGTASEEKIFVGARSSGSCSSCTRGIDGTSGVSHLSGAVVRHVLIAQDLSEANAVAAAMTTKGDLLSRNSTATAAPQRLAIGTDHKFLRARSAATLNLQYDYAPLVFATTSARDTELSSPVNGMVCIVTSGDSSDGLYEYNGTSWRKGPGWNAPWGVVASVSTSGSDQTGITSLADITGLTSATWTAISNRLYRVTMSVRPLQVTSTGTQTAGVYTGATGSGTAVVEEFHSVTAGQLGPITYVGFVTGSGSTSVHGRVGSSAGTVTVQNSSQVGRLVVEDIGPTGAPA